MKTKSWKRAGLAAVAVVLMAGALSMNTVGCNPPVSDEATVRIEGRVLNGDGSPAAGIKVKLQKSGVNTLEADWVVGNIVNADATPFLTTETDEDGYYDFEFEGAEANANNQMWAAYFVVYVIHPDDEENQLAVASQSFSFTNQHLTEEIPDMQFWDLALDAVVVDDESVKLTWTETAQAPESGKYLVVFGDGEWSEEVAGTEAIIPLTALEPCREVVKDDPATCDSKLDHTVQVISLTPTLRYRTGRRHYDAENPKGMGVFFRRGENNRAAMTCTGKNVFDVNDGRFAGANAVWKDNALTADDIRCLLVDLGSLHAVEEIFVHNGYVWFHDKADVRFSLSDVEDGLDPAAQWTEVGVWTGQGNFAWYAYAHLETAETGRWLKIEFTDTEEAKPFWHQIGEISVYGDPIDTGE